MKLKEKEEEGSIKQLQVLGDPLFLATKGKQTVNLAENNKRDERTDFGCRQDVCVCV